MAFDLAKFLARFIEESREHCRRLNDGLLQLESAPDDTELLHSLFRSAHTIKGSARMMKIAGINELAHRLEDVLDARRGGNLASGAALTDLLLRGVDGVEAMLNEVEAGNKQVEAPEELCAALGRAASGEAVEPAPDPAPTAGAAPPPAPKAGDETAAAPTAPAPPAPAAAIPAATTETTEAAVPTNEATVEVNSATATAAADPTTPAKARISEYLRVNSAKLDELVGLMGEIVSEHGKLKDHLGRLRAIERLAPAEGETREAGAGAGETTGGAAPPAAERGWRRELRHELAAMEEAFHLEEQLIGGLQNAALKLRMQPLATIFDPLRRTVRDLARERGREVDLTIEGGDTELDRKIIERLGDSLTHMIRNALDHGLENPVERQAAGKPERGLVRLAAEYDSAGVCLTLEDDGRGIALEKVREKALAKKLVTPENLAGMSEAEVINLIFLPGFSTSPIITDLSGRGVGMDVVRRNIVDELRGAVAVESKEGRGSRIILRLPLNLAVFSLFLVRVGREIMALPATSLAEIVAVPATEIITIVSTPAIRLRNQLIPVARLAELVGAPGDTPPALADEPEGAAPGLAAPVEETMLILRDGREKLGLIVDEVIGREEMVGKPLPLHLRGLRLLAGLTLGPRDRIITVLHAPELIRQARTSAGRRVSRPAAPTEVQPRHILVVDDSLNTRELEKSILEAYGYRVDTAEDGEDALAKSAEVQYDLVVTDVEMPRLDGFSLTERLRADERHREVPIIIVTSREKEEDKRRGIAVGADAYIVKGSFDQSSLLATVRSLLD